jgi:diadenosine tetraphosphate (Ap4A) HIT family hydrolase
MKLPTPKPGAIIYDDQKLYITLANYPIAEGHTVVVWKDKVTDLHLLSREDYIYLMNKVDMIRNALLKTLRLKKVYLIYADEINQVHWHLIPRFEEKGFNILIHKPKILKDFSLVQKIKTNL